MVNLHLLGKELFEPCVLFDVVMDEAYRLFPCDFHRSLALFPVIEPGFRPPAYAGTVGIDRNDSRYVETLDVDVEFRQRVDDTAARYGFVMKFFFTAPLIVERYTSCCKAR